MKLSRIFVTSVAIALAVTLSSAAQAGFVTKSWTGSSGFDDQAISFSAIQVNQLVSIQDSSSEGYFHTHNTSVTVTANLDLRIDGVWTNIWSGTTNSVSRIPSNTLSNVIGGIGFGAGSVDGLRLTGSPNQGVIYHSIDGISFTFLEAVPEPTSIALWGLGALGACVYTRRRRRQA